MFEEEGIFLELLTLVLVLVPIIPCHKILAGFTGVEGLAVRIPALILVTDTGFLAAFRSSVTFWLFA